MGAQRIKGLSIMKAVLHAIKKVMTLSKTIDDRLVETSLIEKFMYPKFGPGQLWEEVAAQIVKKGGEIHLQQKVVNLYWENNTVYQVGIQNEKTGDIQHIKPDYVISSMPVRDLIAVMGNDVPTKVKEVATGLVYRDFITVGLLLKKMKIYNETPQKTINDIIPDNWIYIQERDVKVGRLQIFNNWSPYMVNDSNTIWLGLEYFCNEGDGLWTQSKEDFSRFAIGEMVKIGMIAEEDVIDSTVIKMPKAYPAYFGTYNELDQIKSFVNTFRNLYLIGRNGMHRYNNMDHSMLTAMLAVESIVTGDSKKEAIWEVNTEEDYHEKK